MEIRAVVRVQAGDLAAATSEAPWVHPDIGFLCGRLFGGSGISWCKVGREIIFPPWFPILATRGLVAGKLRSNTGTKIASAC